MTTWTITNCTVNDAASLAYNNMSAFFEDPTWVIAWEKGIKLDFLIEQATKRQPRNLLRDRETKRHQKAIDPKTGKVVGYARWVLPDGKGGENLWEEGLVPDVSLEEKARFEEEANSAKWAAGGGAPDMDDYNQVVIKRILSEKPYIKLEYLAVHPENKGKGIGTALVQSGIKQAEKMGLPVFVMAYKAGLGIYIRAGFKEVERHIQDCAKWGLEGVDYGAYFMIYEV